MLGTAAPPRPHEGERWRAHVGGTQFVFAIIVLPMRFVAILLCLLVAVAPTNAWAGASDRSAVVAAARGRAARTAIAQTPRARPADSSHGPGAGHGYSTAADARLSPARVEHEFGIPARNQLAFQNFADRRGLVIDVRPTNPAAVHWLNVGALPKPATIKAKTVNSYDLMLNRNLPRGSRGLVALFKPVMPERPANLSDHDWASLGARYKQRLEEWHRLAPVIGKGDQEGRYRVSASGRVEGLDDKGTWRSITGDHDLFDIRRPDGSRLTRSEEDAVIREMKERNIGVQHGPHVSWSPPVGSWERTKIFEKIMRGHTTGGEPLVRFAPGKAPRIAWASSPAEE